MTAQVVVVIVIVNYNGGACLAECLASLRAQTCDGFTVVVVDNGSTDGSPALVTNLSDARFRLIEAGRNIGFAAACNIGARCEPGAPFIALLNPDAYPEPAWLQCLLEASHRWPGAAAFGSLLIDAADPSVADGTGDEYHMSGRAWRRDHGARRERAARRREAPVFGVCAAAALYRRDAWERAGGLDEDFFCYLEDVDLCFRLRLAGSECVHVPAAVCRHVGSATAGRHSDFSVYHGQRNLLWVYVKNMPSFLFWLLLPMHVALHLASLLLFLLRGQPAVVARAKRDALTGLPAAWRKRRAIQAARTASVGQVWRCLDRRLVPFSRAPST